MLWLWLIDAANSTGFCGNIVLLCAKRMYSEQLVLFQGMDLLLCLLGCCCLAGITDMQLGLGTNTGFLGHLGGAQGTNRMYSEQLVLFQGSCVLTIHAQCLVGTQL